MTAAGPAVAGLVHRLATTPSDFLAPPLVGGRGTVAVAAVVGDVLRRFGRDLSDDWTASLVPARADPATENWLRACLVASWLAADPALAGLFAADDLLRFLGDDLHRMAGLVPADRLVRDPDRREELARRLLRCAGVVPEGESAEQAADRLATLDSIERTRVEAEARAAEERARTVREALARRRAAEAAARASRE